MDNVDAEIADPAAAAFSRCHLLFLAPGLSVFFLSLTVFERYFVGKVQVLVSNREHFLLLVFEFFVFGCKCVTFT